MSADLHLAGKLRRKTAKLGIWVKCYAELDLTKFTLKHHRKDKKIVQEIEITHNTRISLTEEKNVPTIIIENGGPENAIHLIARKSDDSLVQWVMTLRSATFYNPALTMDNFRIIAVLGRGFFGKVMLVQRKDSQQCYAIKTVHKMRLVQSRKVHTILAERAILAKSKHPFIVDLEFAFQTASKFYLGLEYVPGGELLGLMSRQQKISLQQARMYVAEIALALNHLHSIGIVYRDIKPENILIAADGHLKLTDFGLSKDISHTQTTKTFCGTADFMAPEVVKQDVYSYQADWWSLGILTYELIFDESPFYNENRCKMFLSIQNDPPNFPDDADPNVVDFISQLLTKDWKKRPGLDQLKDHPFFGGISMDDYLHKKIKPDYIPEIHNPLDPIYFDREFTGEQPVDSVASVPLNDNDHEAFPNFSYVAEEGGFVNETLQ